MRVHGLAELRPAGRATPPKHTEIPHDETHVPAQSTEALEEAWVSQPDVDPRWPVGHSGSAAEGPPTAVGLIAGLSGRASFTRLRTEGARVRSGPVRLRFGPASGAGIDEPRLGFALGRHIGGAVVRNRLRRRMRAIVVEMHSAHPLPVGDYLFSATRAASSLEFQELSAAIEGCIGEARASLACRQSEDLVR